MCYCSIFRIFLGKGVQRVRKYQKNPGVGVGEAKKAQQHPQKRN